MSIISTKIYLVVFTAMLFLRGPAQQQVHVKYFHVRSAIATLYEDLYIKDNKVISIQDSIITRISPANGEIAAVRRNSKPVTKDYFISNLNADGKVKDFFFTASNREDEYFIHDKVSKPVWKIDETKTKKILGYNCIKATGTFRGASVTAYFTKELPYSAGPFKFYGLPGLILDIREDNKGYNIWKAEKVELAVDPKINFTPQLKGYPKMEMKEFVEMKEAAQNKEFAEILSRMPAGTKTDPQFRNVRPGLEKVFEWEVQ